MTRTGAAAQNYALARVGTTITAGQCLKNVRTWFDLPNKYGTATAAWAGAAWKHTDRPSGNAVVPVWFKSANPAGHVALRIADGSVITVNGTRVSRFESIDKMVAVGYGAYMGWAEDLNGVRIYTAPPPPAPPASSGIVLTIGSKGQHVRNFQTGMRRVFPSYAKESNIKRGQLISIDGDFGAQSAEWARLFQVKTGLDPDGVVGKNTIPELAKYGIVV